MNVTADFSKSSILVFKSRFTKFETNLLSTKEYLTLLCTSKAWHEIFRDNCTSSSCRYCKFIQIHVISKKMLKHNYLLKNCWKLK